MGESNKIKKVYPQDDYILICEFENNIKKKYDMKTLIEEYAVFKNLKQNKDLFNKVIVDSGGYGISWNEKIDLAAEEIWENGEDVSSEDLYCNNKSID